MGTADILIARDRGIPLVVLTSIFQQSAAEFYAKEGTPLKSPADLLNLKMVRKVNDLIDIELQAMMLSEGIDPKKSPYTLIHRAWSILFRVASMSSPAIESLYLISSTSWEYDLKLCAHSVMELIFMGIPCLYQTRLKTSGYFNDKILFLIDIISYRPAHNEEFKKHLVSPAGRSGAA